MTDLSAQDLAKSLTSSYAAQISQLEAQLAMWKSVGQPQMIAVIQRRLDALRRVAETPITSIKIGQTTFRVNKETS